MVLVIVYKDNKMNDPNPPIYTDDEIKEIIVEGEFLN